MAEQVTDKIERVLQEAPYADKIRSYSKPGESQIIFQIKDSSRAAEVPDVWYSVRKKIGDMRGNLPQGIQGPFFNDEFGGVYGVIYALKSEGYSLPEFGLRMPFKPTDFTQVNHHINTVLVGRALRLLDARPVEQVIDWFCGLGNFTLPIARCGAPVLGIEGSAALVKRAQQNAAHRPTAVEG